MSLFLYVQFYSIDLYVYLYTGDTLFDDYSFEVKVSFGVRKFKCSNFVLLQDCLGYLEESLSAQILFFYKTALGIWGPLNFHTNFRIFFFCFCKNVLGICIEFVDQFDNYYYINNIKSDCINIRCLPRCSLISFNNVYSFSEYNN